MKYGRRWIQSSEKRFVVLLVTGWISTQCYVQVTNFGIRYNPDPLYAAYNAYDTVTVFKGNWETYIEFEVIDSSAVPVLYLHMTA